MRHEEPTAELVLASLRRLEDKIAYVNGVCCDTAERSRRRSSVHVPTIEEARSSGAFEQYEQFDSFDDAYSLNGSGNARSKRRSRVNVNAMRAVRMLTGSSTGNQGPKDPKGVLKNSRFRRIAERARGDNNADVQSVLNSEFPDAGAELGAELGRTESLMQISPRAQGGRGWGGHAPKSPRITASKVPNDDAPQRSPMAEHRGSVNSFGFDGDEESQRSKRSGADSDKDGSHSGSVGTSHHSLEIGSHGRKSPVPSGSPADPSVGWGDPDEQSVAESAVTNEPAPHRPSTDLDVETQRRGTTDSVLRNVDDAFDADETDDFVEPEVEVWLPDGRFRRAWDSVYVCLLCTEFWIFTFATFTQELPSTPALITVRFLITIFWWADMYVQVHTAQLTDWEVIESSATLTKKFVKEQLPLDGPISFPIDIILALAGQDMWSYILMGFRMLRLRYVKGLFGHSTPTRETSKLIESLLFSAFTLCCVHLCACIWMAAAPESELSFDENGTLFDDYSVALYYTVTTLTSVGYGDFSPDEPRMQLFNVFVQLLGLSLMMIVSGRTGAYFVTTDPYQLLLLDRKRRLEHVMSNAEIPWGIQKEAFAIYPSLLDNSTKDYQATLQQLPEFIQEKITNHIKVQLISRVPMFDGLAHGLLRHLAVVVEEEIHGSKECLIRAGDIGSEMYFIMHGIVEVLIPVGNDKEQWVATLKAGSWFGEIALLKATKRTASVVSVTACVLFKLERSDFKTVLDRSQALRTRVQVETDRRFEAMRKQQQEKEETQHNKKETQEPSPGAEAETEKPDAKEKQP
eukprot:TRINITY_DN1935_c3_g1_i1.p1 TRINITY_DN1935_c3_g1~~TRINITY_DN1935_c3_g1_i1.p1  ORF type:complete len:801 (+),score=176.73 TRINITY_DN1935_c3_g1_i1:133-2535(+)